MSQNPENMSPIMQNRIGEEAEPFELSDVHGNVYRLADYRGDWLLMMFHRHLG